MAPSRPLLRDRYGRYVAIDAPVHRARVKHKHKPKPKPKPKPKTKHRSRKPHKRHSHRTYAAAAPAAAPEDQEQEQQQPEPQPQPEPEVVVMDTPAPVDTAPPPETDTGDDDSGPQGVFSAAMAALVAILLALAVAATNFFLYADMREPPFPYYERLGEAGSTIAIALILTLFVLGATYRIEASYPVVFALLSIVFLLLVILERSDSVSFLVGPEVYQVGLFGAAATALIALLSSGNSTSIALSMPYLAVLVITGLDNLGIIQVESENDTAAN